jgi:hypothetical protein
MTDRASNVWTLILVTTIAVVIWLWAADETRQQEERSATIVVESADPEHFAVKPAKGRPVTIKILGSSRSLTEIQRALRDTIVIQTGATAVPNQVGVHRVDVATALNSHPKFLEAAATVVTAEPAGLDIQICERVPMRIPVEVALPDVRLQGSASVEPAQAPIMVADVVQQVFANARLEATIDPQQLAALERGQVHTLTGQWRLPAALAAYAEDVTLPSTPPRITFTLESQLATTTVARVPVQISGVAEDLAAYDIRIEEADVYLKDVKLTGPIDQIRRIQAGTEEVKIVAFVHLTSNDLALRVTRKPIGLWLLPPGVSVVPLEGRGGPPQVGLRIVERSAATPH